MASKQKSSPDGDNVEVVSNEERGCGHLKEGKAYLRGEVSPDGVLPPFVEFEEPIPFLEGHQRGYSYFPGVQFELQHTPAPDDYHLGKDAHIPAVVNDAASMTTVVRDEPNVLDTLRAAEPGEDMHTAGWTTRADPPLEVHRHLRRLRGDTTEGDHIGEMRSARAHDLLMWVGETYYDTPEEYIEETKRQGLSKAIPTSENQEPPVVNPGRTRVFLVHPKAVPTGRNDDGERTFVPGVIGYAYITRVVYTGIETGNGVDFPEWAQEMAEAGRMDLVKAGEAIPREAAENGSTLEDWTEEDEDAEMPTEAEKEEAGEMVDGMLDEAAEIVEESDEDSVGSKPSDSGADEPGLREVLSDLPFQKLREKAKEHELDVGQNPTKDAVIDAIVEADLASVVSGDSDGS